MIAVLLRTSILDVRMSAFLLRERKGLEEYDVIQKM